MQQHHSRHAHAHPHHDDHKESALYNAYMGVDDRSYRLQPTGTAAAAAHSPPFAHGKHHGRHYVSKRSGVAPSDAMHMNALHRTQSTPQKRNPYHYQQHYQHQQPQQQSSSHAAPYVPQDRARAQQYAQPPPTSSSYTHHMVPVARGASHPPPPHPYHYYSTQRAQTMSHDSYSYRSPGPQSPVMHVASKARHVSHAKPVKSPRSTIYQVPSLLSKSKTHNPAVKSPATDGLDIGMATLNEHDDVDLDMSALLPSPVVHVHRQYSEPDAKTMRDLEHLPPTPPFGGLSPLSPAKHAQSPEHGHLDELGLPPNLQHAKTTPLAYLHEHATSASAYDHVNAHFYGHGQHQHHPRPYAPAPASRDRNFRITDQYDVHTGYTHYNIHANNAYARQSPPQTQTQAMMMMAPDKSGAKTRKKKKNKKQQQQTNVAFAPPTATATVAALPLSVYDVTCFAAMNHGYDFAVHDLSQRLVALKQELNDLEQQIMATDDQTKHSESSLRQTTAEQKKVLHGLQMEKMVLQKSLDLMQDEEDDDANNHDEKEVMTVPSKVKTNAAKKDVHAEEVQGYDDAQISEFWSKQCQQLRRDLDKVRIKNRAAAAASDVMHNHLRAQLDDAQSQLQNAQSQRGRTRDKNMQFELEVIELTELVNTLKENVDTQRHDNFLQLSKLREREKLEQAQRDLLDEKTSEDRHDDEADNGDGDDREKTPSASAVQNRKKLTPSRAHAHVLNVRVVCAEYPPELMIQYSLIRAQTEFYFSDYNLKRDKRLLEKICKEPRRGYLAADEVLNLSRVRQLCTSDAQLFEALKSSPYIDMILSDAEQVRWQEQQRQQKQTPATMAATTTMTTTMMRMEGGDHGDTDSKEVADGIAEEDGFHPVFIGRRRFIPPSEKQFPFRRSVYIYGLPVYADEKYIYDMLNAFGGVTKVQFDHGPDTLDRQIMQKMVEKHRVYKLLSKDSAALTMEFNQMAASKQEQYHCYWCNKQKPCADGYYHPKRMPATPPSYRVCLQCAAAKSEEQSHKYDARSKLLKDDKRLRELLLGLPPRAMEQCQTALCVFASQRQASKCVYVRSRLAYDGAFATHYHHYSKLKKEIAMSIKPKIRFIAEQATKPPMLQTCTAPVYQQEGTAVIQGHASGAKKEKEKDNDAAQDETAK